MAAALILTCSAYLTKPGKLAELMTAVDSLISSHAPSELGLVREFIVINEYAPKVNEHFRASIESLHPMIEFIQKDVHSRGQARTLNMILERIRGYEYWIHWEESWKCTRRFFGEALDVMQNTELTQLQVTPDWFDVEPRRIVPSITTAGTHYARILPHPKTAQLLNGATINEYDMLLRLFGMPVVWPLFSLRPAIHRASFCRNVGIFNEDPQHWPVRFEWHYAVRWFARGATKAVLVPHAAQRQANHVSTYQ